MNDVRDTLFMRAACGENTARPPVWLMRQAGRSDPAYRAFRAAAEMPLEALFRNPDCATEISLMPRRWGVDGIIFFQDILTPLEGMGAAFVFRPGPTLEKPLGGTADFDRLHGFDVADEMPFIAQVFHLLRKAVGLSLPLLGFAGAPMTLLAFLAENGSPPPTLPKTRALLRDHPQTVRTVLDKLTDMTIDYLRYQRASGADALQLFESVAHYLSASEYREYALPCQQRIFDALADGGPTIFFARIEDTHIPLALLGATGASILSLPAVVSIAQARAALGAGLIVQGNISNHLLAEADPSGVVEATRACIEAGGCRGHILNLSHGLLPHTPHENVCALVNTVRSWKQTG